MNVFESKGRTHAVELRARVRPSADGSWNQVAYVGEWQGHSAGEFRFTREIFERIIANFKRREEDIPATYGHPDDVTGAYHGAAGWVSDLKIDTDHKGRTALFAKFEFNQEAAQKIADDKLRYCSVVVGFESFDEVSGDPIGAELFEVGLVLAPFISGMEPLRLSKINRVLMARAQTRRSTP